MSNSQISMGSAVGKGEWHKVIELSKDSNDDNKVYCNTMIAYAYEQLKNINMAKKYYYLVLEEDENNLQAIEQLSMIYAKEKNHIEAYKYVEIGLYNSKFDNNYIVKFFSFFIDIFKKILHPSYSFRNMRKATKQNTNSPNDWIRWALEYKNWYEKNIQK